MARPRDQGTLALVRPLQTAASAFTSHSSDRRFPKKAIRALMDHQKQHSHKGNAPGPRSGSAASGRHGKGAKGGGGAGGKKPIKVVYISNPMRVKTSAEGFRALVQELTGRHADPSKYSPDDFDDDDRDGADAAQEHSPEGGAAASPDTGAGPVAAAGQPDIAAVAAFGGGDGDEEEDIFRSQLLDNNYSVFSPPTLLYDHPHGNKFPFG